EAAQLLRLAAVHRREYDAKFSRTGLLQIFEDRIAVECREIDVEQQQRRLRATLRVQRLEQVQRFAAVAKVQEAIAPRFEAEREQIGQRGIVFDDDDFRDVAVWRDGGRWRSVEVRGRWWRFGRGRYRRGCRLLHEQRRSQPSDEGPGCLAPISHAVAGLLQPLFRGFFELGGDDRCLGKTEGAG